MKKIQNFIGGEMRPAASGRTLETVDPATGAAYATLPDSDAADVQAATQAAAAAFPAWSALPPRDRAQYLRRIADLIRAKKEELARAESIDSGKPLLNARNMDIPRAAQNFEFYADAITQFASESHLSDPHTLNYTLRAPHGVVACISPWNFPLHLLTWKIAPALAAGNSVVAKPSEVTPMTAHLLSEIAHEAGLPPGVLNILHGTGHGTGSALVCSDRIRAVSFTGSTRTGAEIALQTAGQFKKLSLEMGGKNATIVFADCDFDEAVSQALRAAFSNQGQICLCGSRILVERPLYDLFRDALVERTRQLRVGDPLEEATDQGAVVSKAHYEKILAHLELARKEGGRFLTGGNAAQVSGRCAGGWFIEPTLIEGLPPACRTNQEEIFGPVATLIPFDTEDEALAIANGTRYGLAASLFTRDLKRAHAMAGRLQTGMVWINCWMERDLRVPFGGTKDSGVGREGGWDALRFFTEAKNVCVRY